MPEDPGGFTGAFLIAAVLPFAIVEECYWLTLRAR